MNGDAWTSHHQTVNSNIVATFQPASLTQLFSIIYLRVISTQFFLLLFFLLSTRSSTRDPFVFPRFFFPSFFFFFCPPIIDTGSNSEGPRGEGEPFRSTIEATRPGASNGKKKKKKTKGTVGTRGRGDISNATTATQQRKKGGEKRDDRTFTYAKSKRPITEAAPGRSSASLVARRYTAYFGIRLTVITNRRKNGRGEPRFFQSKTFLPDTIR